MSKCYLIEKLEFQRSSFIWPHFYSAVLCVRGFNHVRGFKHQPTYMYIFPKNSRRSLIRGLATERRLQVITCWHILYAVFTEL